MGRRFLGQRFPGSDFLRGGFLSPDFLGSSFLGCSRLRGQLQGLEAKLETLQHLGKQLDFLLGALIGCGLGAFLAAGAVARGQALTLVQIPIFLPQGAGTLDTLLNPRLRQLFDRSLEAGLKQLELGPVA